MPIFDQEARKQLCHWGVLLPKRMIICRGKDPQNLKWFLGCSMALVVIIVVWPQLRLLRLHPSKCSHPPPPAPHHRHPPHPPPHHHHDYHDYNYILQSPVLPSENWHRTWKCTPIKRDSFWTRSFCFWWCIATSTIMILSIFVADAAGLKLTWAGAYACAICSLPRASWPSQEVHGCKGDRSSYQLGLIWIDDIIFAHLCDKNLSNHWMSEDIVYCWRFSEFHYQKRDILCLG